MFMMLCKQENKFSFTRVFKRRVDYLREIPSKLFHLLLFLKEKRHPSIYSMLQRLQQKGRSIISKCNIT